MRLGLIGSSLSRPHARLRRRNHRFEEAAVERKIHLSLSESFKRLPNGEERSCRTRAKYALISMRPSWVMMYEYVRVEKISASHEPVVAAGCPATYGYGEECPGVSLPEGYELEGWLVGKLVVGIPVTIFRQVRNGVETLGFFTSTPVTEVRSENEFCRLVSGRAGATCPRRSKPCFPAGSSIPPCR